MDDDEPSYFKVLAELEASRRNAGDLTLETFCRPNENPEPDGRRSGAGALTLEQIEIDGGPVLRTRPENVSLLKLCLVALAVFGVMVLLAALLFPSDEPHETNTRGPTQTWAGVPRTIADVPDHELHEAFEADVAEAELKLRQQRQSKR
jgi:hypothetical protein